MPPDATRIRLLASPAEAYEAMLGAIEGARHSVYLEVYGFRRDAVGLRFTRALTDAARRGVRVEATVDGWGSVRSGRELVRELRLTGARASVYHPFLSTFRGRLRRDHRKLLLVDDRLAYLGGLNVGAQFLGDHAWADLELELEGPACASLGRRLHGGRRGSGEPGLRVLLSSESGSRALRRAYLKAIGGARDRILIAQSYFVPDRRLARSLRAAARRGVAVTLLLPGRSDVPLIRAAMRLYYRGLLRAGVHLYEWRPGVLHAKVAAVDGEVALVGSFNFDSLSLVNLEVLARVRRPELAGAVEAWIGEKLLEARRVELAPPGFWNDAWESVGRGVLALLSIASRAIDRSLAKGARPGDGFQGG